MPAPDGTLSAAVDFDGTLVEANLTPLRWRPKAKEFVLGAAAAGVRLVLHSGRCTSTANMVNGGPWDADDFWRSGRVAEGIEYSWALYEEMRAFLDAEGVWPLLTPWTGPGKPMCDVFIDDRAEPPDWPRLAAELGVHLAPAFPGGVDSAHAQQSGSPADVQRGTSPSGPATGATSPVDPGRPLPPPAT